MTESVTLEVNRSCPVTLSLSLREESGKKESPRTMLHRVLFRRALPERIPLEQQVQHNGKGNYSISNPFPSHFDKLSMMESVMICATEANQSPPGRIL